MYKFIVSCYYWPAGERGLRLRASIIKQLTGETGHGLNYPRLGLTSLDNLASSIERRRMRRLRVRCEVELTATLSLLDNDVQNCESSLIFLGRTHDLSAAVIGMEVSPVRCERLKGPFVGQGYLLGTKITNVDDRARFEQYLETLSDKSKSISGICGQ